MDDNKRSEEVKDGMNKLAEAMLKSNEEVKNIGESHNETKQLVDGIAEDLTGLKENDLAKMQDHLDEIDASVKALGSSDKKQAKQGLEAILDSADFKEFAEKMENGSISGKSFPIKAADMTSGNVLAAQAGEFMPSQQVRGVVFEPEWPTHMRQIVPTASMAGKSITFPVETYDDGTAVRAEGAAMAQSDFDFAMTTKNVTNISAYMNITRDFLSDAPALNGYINGRLMDKLLKLEDTEILNGTDASDRLDGLTTSQTTATDQTADSKVNHFDILYAAVVQCRVANHSPNWIIMHPSDTLFLYRAKDDNGMYIYPGDIKAGGRLTVAGVPIFEHSTITQTQFLVADLSPSNVQYFIREGASIEMWNQDGNNARSREITITANIRALQAIYRTSALIGGDFDTLLGSGSA